MRQAIVTKYHGPTNTRGSRISARAYAGRVSVPYEYALSVEENHAAACRAFAAKFGWFGTWIAGANPDQTGNTYCMRAFKSDAERRKFRDAKRIVVESWS